VSAAITHVAGFRIHVNGHLRQRCAWCGALLLDYELERTAVPVGQDPQPALWEPGALVEVDGGASWVVSHQEDDELPVNACARIDDTVTA
jgi:hypothetical protein